MTNTRSSNVDAERLSRYYSDMLRVRAFEQAALCALEQGLVHGAIHPSIGQEAVAVGVCGRLRRDDQLLSTHRGHGHTLAKGADPEAMMRELFGKQGGCCGGKGGSMHIADFDVGMLGANGVVAANITIAAGAAHAIRLRGGDQIVACFFGDGAVNRGPFLEGLNWAAARRLPVLFVCEDNQYAATTRSAALTAGPGIAARADSLGVPATEVDGNDVVAVDAAAERLASAARAGAGPQLLLARTYRLSGHTGTDPAAYRDAAEVEARWQKEPIGRCRELLSAAGVDAAWLDQQSERADAEMRAVAAAAAAAPWPEHAALYQDIQDLDDQRHVPRAACDNV